MSAIVGEREEVVVNPHVRLGASAAGGEETEKKRKMECGKPEEVKGLHPMKLDNKFFLFII